MSVKAQLVVVLFVFCGIFSCAAWAGDGKPIDAANVSQAFNPGTGAAGINYTLDNDGSAMIALQIVDQAGRAVRIIDGGIQGSGRHSILWNGTDNLGRPVPDGRYNATVYDIDGVIDTSWFLLTRPSDAIFEKSGLRYYPAGPAVDAAGNIYVTDSRHDRVWKYDRFGNLLTGWGSTGSRRRTVHEPLRDRHRQPWLRLCC